MPDAIEKIEDNVWLLQPGDRIVATFADILKAEPAFKAVFGEAIFPYKRMDISTRELPALRLYNDTGHKEGETWYSGGDLTIDLIFPLSIRREQLQALTDTVTSALISEFRRPSMLAAMREKVPGLNRIGWMIDYDKALQFQASDSDDPIPMTQIVADWRVLLNEWDRGFLEQDDRTVDDPFVRTLDDLKNLAFTVLGKTEDGTTQVTEHTQVRGTPSPSEE